MKPQTPSRTAQYMALFRALESNLPRNQRLFTDRLATLFLDKKLELIVALSWLPLIGKAIRENVELRSAGAMSAGIARTKYIDELIGKLVSEGIQQVMILGAGFDTRAFRLSILQSIPVIEIDHPDTSQFKQSILEQRKIALPNNARYLKLDFTQQTLEDLSKEHKIDFTLRTLILWEGVTNYLSIDAIDSTFKWIRKFNSGSYIIFTYIHQDALNHPEKYKGLEKVETYLEDSEEKWATGFLPESMPAYLESFGLQLISDLDVTSYRQFYMEGRKGFLSGYEFYRVAVASRKI